MRNHEHLFFSSAFLEKRRVFVFESAGIPHPEKEKEKPLTESTLRKMFARLRAKVGEPKTPPSFLNGKRIGKDGSAIQSRNGPQDDEKEIPPSNTKTLFPFSNIFEKNTLSPTQTEILKNITTLLGYKPGTLRHLKNWGPKSEKNNFSCWDWVNAAYAASGMRRGKPLFRKGRRAGSREYFSRLDTIAAGDWLW